MNEQQFSDEIYQRLKEEIKPYQVSQGESLLYKLIVDTDGKLKPRDISNPTRGQYAFQTDILVKDKKTPLVVLELKYGGLSTHDVLTYSAKAIKHKEIYPYLRYGLIVGGQETVDKRFFTHNVGFDFAIMIEDIAKADEELVKIIRNQARISEQLKEILKGKQVKRYEEDIKFS